MQQVEEAFGIPVVSVVGLSHLMAYIASKGNNGGADAEVNLRDYDVDEVELTNSEILDLRSVSW